MPAAIERMGVTPFTDFDAALEGADVVMMLRLQNERMDGGFIPSTREFHMRYGLTPERLDARQARCAGDASRPDEPRRRDRLSSVADHPDALGDHRTGRDGRRGAHGLPRRADARARGVEGWA